MKKNRLLSAAVFLLFISLAVLYGCKKNTISETKNQTDLREVYKQKLKNEPVTSTQIVNQKGKGYYGDINGNKLTTFPVTVNRSDAFTCPDPGDSEFDFEFESMTREFTCGIGYRFLVTFKITSEFEILFDNGTNISSGRVRFRNSSNVTIHTTDPAALLSIQNNGSVGTNGNGDDMYEFIITFRTPVVSESIYNASASIQPSLFAYTDCSNYPTITIPFSTQVSTAGSQHINLPCLRIDKVYWNAATSNPYVPPNLAGADPTGSGCFPYGYVFPHKQEIWFKNGSGEWKKFYLHTSGLGQPGVETDLINYWDVWYIDVSLSQSNNGLSPGNVEVRYRNNHMNGSGNGAPCVTQPADTWVYETWYIN